MQFDSTANPANPADTATMLAEAGAPHPNAHNETVSDWELRQAHDEMLKDLHFELTMAGIDGYEAAMDKHRQAVAERFAVE